MFRDFGKEKHQFNTYIISTRSG
ncbi:BnaC03g34710D [Brassica napus]|uniref:BnaC03g34710D protein n=1 Tax=Brassica napus TaxID=3708 RepID=A0A078F4S2_BRANA|nr:BnaC03g34710D [Brassica napus]